MNEEAIRALLVGEEVLLQDGRKGKVSDIRFKETPRYDLKIRLSNGAVEWHNANTVELMK